jgi:hypothetical protein
MGPRSCLGSENADSPKRNSQCFSECHALRVARAVAVPALVVPATIGRHGSGWHTCADTVVPLCRPQPCRRFARPTRRPRAARLRLSSVAGRPRVALSSASLSLRLALVLGAIRIAHEQFCATRSDFFALERCCDPPDACHVAPKRGPRRFPRFAMAGLRDRR